MHRLVVDYTRELVFFRIVVLFEADAEGVAPESLDAVAGVQS